MYGGDNFCMLDFDILFLYVYLLGVLLCIVYFIEVDFQFCVYFFLLVFQLFKDLVLEVWLFFNEIYNGDIDFLCGFFVRFNFILFNVMLAFQKVIIFIGYIVFF